MECREREKGEGKVVACTAGTDTGYAVHQANALTMHLRVNGTGPQKQQSARTYAAQYERQFRGGGSGTRMDSPYRHCGIISCQ